MIEALIALAILGVGGAAVAMANRPEKTNRRSRGGGKSGPSRLVRAYTAATGRKTSARTAGDLAAEVGGRVAGRAGRATGRVGKRAGKAAGRPVAAGGRATGRAGKRAGQATGRAATARAGHRWDNRTSGDGDEPVPLFHRRRGHDTNENEPEPEPTARADRGDRADESSGAAGDSAATPGGESPPPEVTPIRNKTGGAPVNVNEQQQSAAPPDLAQVINRVASYEPEDVPDLMNFMGGEVSGMCGYADALTQVVDNCVNSVGLDPQSMAGVSDYSQAVTDAANTMALAHKQFMAVYQEVMEAVDKGVQMPYNGRWFSAA